MIYILLVLTWVLLWGTFDLRTLSTGIAYGAICLAIVLQLYRRRPWPSRRGLARTGRVLQLGAVFLIELVRSTLEVTVEVLRPRIRVKPAIVAVPLDAKTDVQITALANLVSLTPGTLSIDVSSDRKVLFVHALTIDDDGTETRRAIKQRLERQVMQAL